MTKDSVILGV